jgi:hypothetical protein
VSGTNAVNSVSVDVKQILKWSEMIFHYSVALWLCFIHYLAFGMGLRNLTFVGRDLEDGKKLMSI